VGGGWAQRKTGASENFQRTRPDNTAASKASMALACLAILTIRGLSCHFSANGGWIRAQSANLHEFIASFLISIKRQT
jgi:hypothetical protein